MIVPTTFTFSAGSILTAAQLNTYLTAAITYYLAPPLAVLRQTVAGTFNNATWTSVSFDTEDIDRDNGHSPVTNPSRYTSNTAGWYLPGGKISFAVNATGRRWTRWAVHGTEVNAARINEMAASGDATEVPAAARWVFLNVGDYLELQGYQDSGGAVNTVVTTVGDQPFFALQWMST